MKDRNGVDLDFGDVVVVERGPRKGLVGRVEAAHGARWVDVAADLWAPFASMQTVALVDLRIANDIEAARWKRDAKAREKAASEAWLNGTPLPEHLKGD
jgi:uncharacterized protein YdaU (DUF1376 family)